MRNDHLSVDKNEMDGIVQNNQPIAEWKHYLSNINSTVDVD